MSNLEPVIVDTCTPLDHELSRLLGEEPVDFIVLCFNGQPLNGYGTPRDTPNERATFDRFVARLNDASEKSWWPDMFKGHKPKFISQFNLHENASEKDFRPKASWRIHRVCAGHSSFLHLAIRLFEHDQVKRLINKWKVGITDHAFVEIDSITGQRYREIDYCNCPVEKLPVAIGRAVKRLLEADGRPQ